MSKNRIIPQMFDVRPVDETGDLDWKKIQSIGLAESDQAPVFHEPQFCIGDDPSWKREEILPDNNDDQHDFLNAEVERLRQEQELIAGRIQRYQEELGGREKFLKKNLQKKNVGTAKFFKTKKKKAKIVFGHSLHSFKFSEMFSPERFALQFGGKKLALSFAAIILVISLSIGGIIFTSKGVGLKGTVLGSSQEGYADLTSAMSDLANQNFEQSTKKFDDAYANFSKSSDSINEMGGTIMDFTRFIPFTSQVSSGKNAVEAGKHLSAAGQALSEVAQTISNIKNPIASDAKVNVSLLDIFQSLEKNIAVAKTELDAAQKNLDNISIDDLPSDKQDKFLLLKKSLPELRSGLDAFLNNTHIFADLLGGNGPRKYLFLFQNNSEMRAPGGFIGSYGLLDIFNGQVKKFFIDGIFNPDGQLRDKIVPPAPIQKISANWSMHDSNWFPDFPMSAQKAINFYEKTGGPTADGVISFTPTLMRKLLEITGPIDMPEYGVTLDSHNFIEMTQYKVEVDYDKEDNQPKKILADLASLVLEKLSSSLDIGTVAKTAQAFIAGLQEKHILLYSQNSDLQKIISQQGWSGEILPAQKDYLSVINTNINGFKTDAVIDESISHKAEIQDDGSIIDTVTISRKHNGGNSEYEWLNKVNADYVRVYVPQGSKLLEASGQTRETDNPPLDYDALGFKRDEDVQKEENSIVIDPESGTRIYEQNGKTVFANWTYVSPQETMTLTYKYLLPFSLFKVNVGKGEKVDSYSLVAQKQSGSVGSRFSSQIFYPQSYSQKWKFPDDGIDKNREILNNTKLDVDRFIGAVFQKS